MIWSIIIQFSNSYFFKNLILCVSYTLFSAQMTNEMVRELENTDLLLTQFDEKLWRIMVENVTVGLDGEMVFRFRNGMEVTVE